MFSMLKKKKILMYVEQNRIEYRIEYIIEYFYWENLHIQKMFSIYMKYII